MAITVASVFNFKYGNRNQSDDVLGDGAMSQVAAPEMTARNGLDQLGSALTVPPSGQEPATDQRREEIRGQMRFTDPDGFANGPASRTSAFADQVLAHVASTDLGTVHDKLVELTLIQKGLGADKLKKENHGFISRLTFNFQRELEKFHSRFESAKTSIDRVAANLEKDQRESALAIQTLGAMGQDTMEAFRDLALHVEEGEAQLVDWKQEVEALDGGADTVAASDQLVATMEQRERRFTLEQWERKITNLARVRTIMAGLIPTIHQTMQSERVVTEELATALQQTIPLMKQQTALFLHQAKQGERLESLKATRDMTEAMMAQVAKQLGDNADALAEEMTHGVASADRIVGFLDDIATGLERIDQKVAEAMSQQGEARRMLSDATGEFTQRLSRRAA